MTTDFPYNLALHHLTEATDKQRAITTGPDTSALIGIGYAIVAVAEELTELRKQLDEKSA